MHDAVDSERASGGKIMVVQSAGTTMMIAFIITLGEIM
jgi:hypothetical protein